MRTEHVEQSVAHRSMRSRYSGPFVAVLMPEPRAVLAAKSSTLLVTKWSRAIIFATRGSDPDLGTSIHEDTGGRSAGLRMWPVGLQ